MCVCVCDAKVTQLHSFCLYRFIWGSILSQCRLTLSRHSAGFFHSANILHYFTPPPLLSPSRYLFFIFTWLASYSSAPPLPSHGSHLRCFELRRDEWACSHWQLKLQTSLKLLTLILNVFLYNMLFNRLGWDWQVSKMELLYFPVAWGKKKRLCAERLLKIK